MRKALNATAFLVVLTMMLFHFNSCQNYSEDPAFDPSSEECQENCPDKDLLQVTVASVPPINNNDNSFQISGQCDDGDYPNNRIQWRIMYGGQDVMNSQAAGSGAYVTTCSNGTYSMLGRTPCPNAGFVFFNGGNCLGLAGTATLEVQIVGIDGEKQEINPDTTLGGDTTLLLRAF